MKKRLLLSVLVLSIFITGCQKVKFEVNSDTNKSDEGESDYFYDTEEVIDFKDNEIIPVGEEIIEADENYGTMKYIVTGYKEYDNVNDANLQKGDILKAYSWFTNRKDDKKYYDIEEYVDDNGQVASECVFVLIDMKIENIDAIGYEKKNEFNISKVCLYTPSPITRYEPSYFSIGFDSEPLAYHYTIEQGENKDIQLGYIVLEKDLDKLMGGLNIGNNEALKFQLQ